MEIKRMAAGDVDSYKQDVIGFIYESIKMSNYEENYQLRQAEKKCDELYGHLLADKAIAVGAFEGRRMVGFLWAYEHPFREDTNRLYVSIVHVKENYRDQHVGTAMMEKIEAIAREGNYGSIYLHAEASNEKACRFYSRMGYDKERIQLVKRIEATNRKYTGGG